MEMLLLFNGFEIAAEIDEQESIMLKLASGELSCVDLETWLESRITPFPGR